MIYRKLALAGAVTLALATTVNAQDASYLDIERPANSPYQLRASDLLGMDVENFNGDEIGEIDDLIISSDNTPTAVISVGGFLGLGDKLVAIPYNELKFDSEREDVVYNATEEQLKSLPEFNYLEGESTWSEIQTQRQAMQDKATQMMSDAKDKTTEAVETVKDKTAETVESVQEADIWHQIAGNWNQFKGKVKQQWGDLTDDELTVIEGNRDMLIGKIQKQYGISKQEAEQQVDSWANTL